MIWGAAKTNSRGTLVVSRTSHPTMRFVLSGVSRSRPGAPVDAGTER